jgi:hypothetical protein
MTAAPYRALLSALMLATGCADRDSVAQSQEIAVQHYSFAWRDEHRLDPLSADTAAKREYLVSTVSS